VVGTRAAYLVLDQCKAQTPFPLVGGSTLRAPATVRGAPALPLPLGHKKLTQDREPSPCSACFCEVQPGVDTSLYY